MKYHLTSRIIHWIMSILIIFMIGLGIFMSDFLEKTNLDRTKVYELHKSLGVLVIIFFVYRLINRIIHQPPALPIGLKNYEKTLTKLVHFSLYLLMIIAPLSGYLMSNAYGFEVKFFGIILPNLISGNMDLAKIFSEVHEISAFTLAGLIVLHILGALKHRFFDRKENDVLNRML